MEEIWMPWHKNNAYLVSNFGNVKGQKGYILSTCLNKKGYVTLSTRMPDSRSAVRTAVHRMVLETFCPVENMSSLDVDHIDGNPANNNITNLRWVTSEENNQQKVIHRAAINKEVNRLIHKYGYEKTAELICNLD